MRYLPSFDKTQQYDIGFDDNNVVSQDYGVLGISSVGGPAYDQYLYPHYTGFDQQEINQGYEDAGFINESAPTQSRFPYGSIGFKQQIFLPRKFSTSQTGMVLVLLPYLVLESRELLLQVVQHLYSTLLVVLTRDTLLRLQKEQFCSISSGIALLRVVQETLLDLEISLFQEELESQLTARVFDTTDIVSGITTISGAAVVKSSFDPPEGTYLHIFGGGYSELKVTFAAQSEKATLRLIGELTASRYRLHTSLWYRKEHWYRDRTYTLAWWWLEGNTEILALLPQGSFRSIHLLVLSSNSMDVQYPEQTHLYQLTVLSTFLVLVLLETVLEAQTEKEISKVSNLVRRRDSFQLPSLVLDLSYSTSRQLVQNQVPEELWLLWRRQRSRHIWSNHYPSGRWYSHSREDHQDLQDRWNWNIHIQWCWSRRGNNISPKLDLVLYSQSVVYQKPRQAAELVAGTSIFNGTGRRMPSSAQTPENTATLTLSGDRSVAFNADTSSMDLELSHSEGTIKSCYWCSSICYWIRYIQWTWWSCRGNSRTICCKSNSYRYHMVLQKQDTSKYSKTSFHLVHSHYLENLHIQISTSLQHTLVLEMLLSLELPTRKDVFREIGVGIATFSGSAILRFTADSVEGTVLFDTKGASAITKLHWLYSPTASGITTISGISATREIQNYGYYGDDKDPGTSGGFTFSNTPLVHPDVRYIPSIGIGVAVLYQTGGTALESFSRGNYTTQGFFKGLAGSKESSSRATYVGIGQVNTFGAGQTEYACYRRR